MHVLSRRGVALIATAATLGAGSLATASQAVGAASTAIGSSDATSQRGPLDPVVAIVLGLLGPTSSIADIQGLITTFGLSNAQIGNLLDNADANEVSGLLAALNTSQLTGAVDSLLAVGGLDAFLDTLNVGQTGDLLAPLTGSTLSSTLGLLSTSQITGALGTLTSGELSSVVDGLTAAQTGQVLDALSSGDVSQLDAVLGALTGGQLGGALDTLSVAQLDNVLAPLSGAQLQTVLGALSSGEINGVLAIADAADVLQIVGALTPSQLSGVLGVADPTQVLSLVGVLTPSQLASVLDISDPAQVLSLVGVATPSQLSGALGLLDVADLTSVVGLLTPAQITSLLSDPASATSLVTGLAGKASGLAGSSDLLAITALLGQVDALLGGGLPAVPGIEGLLTTVNSLLGTAGLDTTTLQHLLTTAGVAAGAAAPGPGATALQTVIGTLGGLLGLTPGGGTVPNTNLPKPGTLLPGGGTAPRPGAGFTAYRAAIVSVRVAKNRKSVTIRVSCPSIAPKGCYVALSGVVAGKRAFTPPKPFVLLRNASQTFTVKLNSSTAKRLKKKGGALKVTALTYFSTLSSVSKSVKVAKTRTAKKR